jgi:hypothetical protein
MDREAIRGGSRWIIGTRGACALKDALGQILISVWDIRMSTMGGFAQHRLRGQEEAE